MGHAFRCAKTCLVILLGLSFLVLAGGAAYLNQVGFPGQYGNWLKSHLAERGIHLSFETLRYDLRRGLVATEVSFCASDSDGSPMLTAEEVILDIDKTKAVRGKMKLRKIEVLDGTASIPVDESGRFVTARDINGALTISESNRAQVDQATGIIEGIQVSLSTDIKLPDRKAQIQKLGDGPKHSNRILSFILDELALWTLNPDQPPSLTFSSRGDLNHPERIRTSFILEAENLSRNLYDLNRLKLAGDFRAQLVTLDQILLEDANGTATGKADWNTNQKEGRFDLMSTLQLQDFLKSCFGIEVLTDLHLHESPLVDVVGTYSAPNGGALSVSAVGHAKTNRFDFLGSPYEGLTSDFSWQDGNLYLRDLEVRHREGSLTGEILSQDNLVQYDLESTLPLEAFRPFIKPDSGLDRTTKAFAFNENSSLKVSAVGSIDQDNLKSWSAQGNVHLENILYRGAAIHYLKADYNFIPGETEFSNISALLNDDRENVRRRFDARASTEMIADRILYESESRLTTISNLRGKVWPSPIVRIFAPKTAAYLEENFRFYQPPSIVLNGSIAGRGTDRNNTRFSVTVRTEGRSNYPFLGKNLPMEKLRADVTVVGREINVKNLSFATLGGTAGGSVIVTTGDGNSYRGSMKWDNLSFPLISRVYQFEKEEKGVLTGSIDFRGSGGSVRQFNADGLIGIRQGNLVSLPILGPLSPLIAGVLEDKQMGYESAKDASATFAIRNGVLQTQDFVAVSNSLNLTGEGWVDLATERMDMTVRLNARGLLGFITLPLQPLKGIFQFRGTGNYSKPNWRSSPFTRPARGNNDPIFRKPGRAQIVPERSR
ncbi:MAG: AsmA-like C-terminal region-containing protein [Akkermansiaceae bacterium]